MVELSMEDWKKKGKELYGEEIGNWRFKCPNCKRIQSVDTIRKQMNEDKKPSQRYGFLKKDDDCNPHLACYSPTCNWVANGLFTTGILVIFDSKGPFDASLKKNCSYVFPFASFNWGVK